MARKLSDDKEEPDHELLDLELEDELSCLHTDEFEALVQFHERERWVWAKMKESAQREPEFHPDVKSPDEYDWIIEFHQRRIRNFNTLAAQVETLMEEHKQKGNK